MISKLKKKILLISGILVLAVTVLWLTVYDPVKDPNDLNHLYTASDFPRADASNARFQEQLIELNNVIEALRNEPDHQYVYDRWVHVANLKVAFEDFSGAEAAYLKAIEVNGENPLAYLNLGTLYKLHLRDYPVAESYYQQALNLIATPYFSDYEVIADLYVNFYKEINFDVEQFMLSGAGRSVGADAVAYYLYLQDYFEQKGNQAKVEEYKQKVIELIPDYYEKMNE